MHDAMAFTKQQMSSDSNRPHGEENRIAHVQTQVINIHELPINTSIHIQ